MAGIYIYSELTQAAAELVTFAKQAGKTAHILVFNQEEAQVAAGFAAETVIFFQGGSQLAENYAKPIAGLLQEPGAEIGCTRTIAEERHRHFRLERQTFPDDFPGRIRASAACRRHEGFQDRCGYQQQCKGADFSGRRLRDRRGYE